MTDITQKPQNKILYYVAHMASRGFSPEQILQGSGLSDEQLNAENFCPTPQQYHSVIRNLITLTGDPHIGLSLGDEFSISDLGVLGYAVLSAATLARAKRLFFKYDILVEHILLPKTTVTNDSWYTELKEVFPLGKLISFAVEEYITRSCGLASSLTNKPFPILELRFTYPQPAEIALYSQRFDCPMFFDQPSNIVLWDIESQNHEISLANDAVNKLCEDQCKLLINQIIHTDLLSTKIRNALVKTPGKFLSLEEMSRLLNMGSRTLRRRLIKENLTYQQILDETRKNLAIQYLEHTSLSPKEIGFLLGYNSVSNFRRAFKGWTGNKLSDYRNEN